MKKVISALFLTLLVGVSYGADKNEDLFVVDEAALEQEFAELDALEAYVLENGGDYETIAQNAGHLLGDLNLEGGNVAQVLAGAGAMEDTPLGIPPFLWGFCLGFVGLAIVYFITEDSDLTKKALYGCIAGTVLSIVFYALFWGAWFASNS